MMVGRLISVTRWNASGVLPSDQRSIDRSELLRLLQRHFGTVTEREVPLRYRQFNASSSAVAERSDAEILFVAGPR